MTYKFKKTRRYDREQMFMEMDNEIMGIKEKKPNMFESEIDSPF